MVPFLIYYHLSQEYYHSKYKLHLDNRCYLGSGRGMRPNRVSLTQPDFDVLPLKEAKKIVEALERERDREEALRQERGGKENEVRLHEMD